MIRFISLSFVCVFVSALSFDAIVLHDSAVRLSSSVKEFAVINERLVAVLDSDPSTVDLSFKAFSVENVLRETASIREQEIATIQKEVIMLQNKFVGLSVDKISFDELSSDNIRINELKEQISVLSGNSLEVVFDEK